MFRICLLILILAGLVALYCGRQGVLTGSAGGSAIDMTEAAQSLVKEGVVTNAGRIIQDVTIRLEMLGPDDSVLSNGAGTESLNVSSFGTAYLLNNLASFSSGDPYALTHLLRGFQAYFSRKRPRRGERITKRSRRSKAFPRSTTVTLRA